jgi:hypothetical protein
MKEWEGWKILMAIWTGLTCSRDSDEPRRRDARGGRRGSPAVSEPVPACKVAGRGVGDAGLWESLCATAGADGQSAV